MSRLSILVAEDEQVAALILHTTLSQMGYIVAAVTTSGEETVAQALALQPDLILMDIGLRGDVDGIAAAGVIRAQAAIPIIYLTAHTDVPTLERARRTTPYGYLIKPFDEQTLHISIEMALERAEVDHTLRGSEERLAAILASIDDAVIATDNAGRVTLLNRTAEHLLRCKIDAVLECKIETIVELLEPGTRKPLPNPLTRAMQTRSSVSLPEAALLHTADGAETWVEGNAAPIFGPAGKIEGAVLALRDATARRQAEHERMLQMRQQEELKYLERLRMLAAWVAHDLNNVLTVMQGHIDLLHYDLTAEEAKHPSFHQISTVMRRAVDLSRQLLAYAGQSRLRFTTLEIERLIGETITLAHSLLNPQIELQVSVAAELPQINGDAVQIQQVLLNLLLNAIEAIGAHKGVIRVEASQRVLDESMRAALGPLHVHDNWPYIVIAVHDTGCGMDAATIQRIFDPFFSTKRSGRGLGLAATQGIMHEHGGTIMVTSAVGSGTTFVLLLPAAAPASSTAPLEL